MENYFDNIHKFKIFQKTFLTSNDVLFPLGYAFIHEPGGNNPGGTAVGEGIGTIGPTSVSLNINPNPITDEEVTFIAQEIFVDTNISIDSLQSSFVTASNVIAGPLSIASAAANPFIIETTPPVVSTPPSNTRNLSTIPQYDFYLPVFITRTSNLMEYVNVTRDDTIFNIQRQEINPWFIEFSFFDTIIRNKSNNGIDLTNAMLLYIKTVRPDVANLADADLRVWFDTRGELGIDKIDLDAIDKLEYLNTNIISKAFKYGIDINK